MTTPNTTEDPDDEQDATADRLCRALVHAARQRERHIDRLTDDGSLLGQTRRRLETHCLNREYAVVLLLKTLSSRAGREYADETARAIWNAWDDYATVGTAGELLHAWAGEYGQLDGETAR